MMSVCHPLRYIVFLLKALGEIGQQRKRLLSCGRNVLGRTDKRSEGAMERKVQTKDFQPGR